MAEDVEPEDDTTVFVKNLNFETIDEGLRDELYKNRSSRKTDSQ